LIGAYYAQKSRYKSTGDDKESAYDKTPFGRVRILSSKRDLHHPLGGKSHGARDDKPYQNLGVAYPCHWVKPVSPSRKLCDARRNAVCIEKAGNDTQENADIDDNDINDTG
jgi:hypothetical protein